MTSALTARFRGTGLAMNNTQMMPVWDIEGNTNYTLKVMPSVTAIDYDTGYATGGQTLTITGTSLDGTDVKVEAHGEICDVKTITLDKVTCVTRGKVLPVAPDPNNPYYIG